MSKTLRERINEPRIKPCATCGTVVAIKYRVRTDSDKTWRLVCPVCQQLAAQQAGYQYGGTWKANKKRK